MKKGRAGDLVLKAGSRRPRLVSRPPDFIFSISFIKLYKLSVQMLESTWNMTNANDTVVGEALPVSIPYEVKGILVTTLGKALKLSCDYKWQTKKLSTLLVYPYRYGQRG